MKFSIIAAMSFSALFAFGIAGASMPVGTTPTAAPPASKTGIGSSGSTPLYGQAAEQDRMNGCNAAATRQKLTGDARKTFVATCMKKQ
ncbi:MAG TPA: PsiF family protein [Xanthomonadaceae bacterium]|jgi:hypothetical protein|nr:PsiF family protein [Xanthomonadaceae bacterium]